MKTSWQGVSKWYNKIVGEEGHYYHQHVVIPGVIRLLQIKNGDSLVDLACGNGVLRRNIKNNIEYLGVDISRNLIDEAKRRGGKDNITVALAQKISTAPQTETKLTRDIELPGNNNDTSAMKLTRDVNLPNGI